MSQRQARQQGQIILWVQAGDLMQLLNQYRVFIQDTLRERWTFCGFLQHTLEFFLVSRTLVWNELRTRSSVMQEKGNIVVGPASHEYHKGKSFFPLFYTFQNIPNFRWIQKKTLLQVAWRKSMIHPFLSLLWTMREWILLVFQTWYIMWVKDDRKIPQYPFKSNETDLTHERYYSV